MLFFSLSFSRGFPFRIEDFGISGVARAEGEEARAVRKKKGSIIYPTQCTQHELRSWGGIPREYPCFIRMHGVDAWATTS